MISSNIKIAMCQFVSFFICLFIKNVNLKVLNFHNYKLFKLNSILALTFLIFNLSFSVSKAQTYPVQINTQLVPPYSGYLPDYADPNAQNLKVFLQFNDFTVAQYNLRLKFEIKGDGFSLVTKAQYNPPPISLEPGQPILLSGADLAPYLNSNNLDFIGFNKNQYEQRMALPEGYYSICITAYDYYSGTPVQVSNEACGQGWFTLSNPPLLNLPLCNTVVNPLQPQNLFFSWTPVNLGSPNSSFNTSYLFELWEMRPDSTVNPNQLVQNTQPIFSQITTFNGFNYGITEPPLNLYYKYAWRVKAIDATGKDWFINNGYSQVCTFYYGSIGNTLGNAVNLNLEAQAVDYVSGVATWTLQSFYNSYQLDVREVNTQDWISYTTTINNQELNNLQPNTTYECRVKGFGNDINSNYSNIVSFTTPNPPSINLQAESLDYITGRAFWLLQNSYNNYQLEVRKKNTPNWFLYNTTGNSQVIDNLESNKTYECRVKGFGTNFTSDYSNIAEFTTPAPPSYNCNQAAPVYSNNTTPLPNNKAISGMTVKSGQFDVKIKFINPGTMGAGYYTGNGYAMMFGLLPIPVTFTNVFIDDKQRQQQGVIHAVTKGMKKWMQQFDIEDAEENATYVEGTLDTVYISNGQYCYLTEQSQTPVCTPIDTTKLPLVIRDGDGNQYVINEGPPPSVTGPTSYLNLSNDNLAATDNLKVQFAKATNQNFGFDSKEYPAFTEEYECIKLSNSKNYFVANKSIGNGINQSDKVIATYTIQNFNASLLAFKTKGGANLTKKGINNNSSFEITNIPPNAECIYAWYNNQKIGKLNIISLNKVNKKVVLVPVNGASTAGITQQGLNDIYKQANAGFNLTTAPNFTFVLGNDGLEEADAKLMSKYSAEMRALRDAYKKKDSLYDKNAYYLFIVPNFSNPQLNGYMVRGRAVGFVKTGVTSTDVAHELAHGAFKLEHTFPAIAKGTSNNLLDYSNNTHLSKSQWLNIQNPSGDLTWFDDEEDGSALNPACNFDVSNKYIYAPNGKLFLSPANSKILQISLGAYGVNGFVYWIEVNGVKYDARIPIRNYGLQEVVNEFEGYYNGSSKLQLSYLTNLPNGSYGYLNIINNNTAKLYKILNAQALSGSTDTGYDLNAGPQITGFINGAEVQTTCNINVPDLTLLQQQLLNKYKAFSKKIETYIYEQGQLITILPSGKAYIRTCSDLQFTNFKQQLKAGEFNSGETSIFEKTASGYKVIVNYGNAVTAKYGGQAAVDASEAALEKVFNEYLKDKQDLSSQHNQQESQSFEDGKKISIKQSNIWDLVCNGIKATKNFIQEAEIKPRYWNTADPDYANNWVNTPPLLSGIGNGVIEEIKEIPQLVTMGAELATSKDARDKLWTSLKGLSLNKIKNAASSSLNSWVDTYSQGGDPAWHQGGKDGVMVFTALTPAGFLKGADDALGKNIDDAVGKVKKKDDEIAGSIVTRGITKKQFFESVDDFKKPENGIIGDQAWELWKQEKWSDLEDLFKKNNINFDSRRSVNWPPNRGFIDFITEPLSVGKEFDRYGGYFDKGVFKDGGNFVSPNGASFGSRALPAKTLEEPYRKYKVIKEIPGVKKGTSAPWFGQDGMGTQYELPYSIDELLKGEFIIQIN